MSFQPSKFSFAISLALVTACVAVGLPAQAGSQGCTNRSANAPTPRSTAMQTAQMQAGTIVEVAAGNSDFTTLVQAVQAAGLVDTLSGPGPFTVFAPTNEAFAALPPGTLENLLKPENRETLRQILTYHVVAGAVRSGDIRPGAVNTVEGSPVRLNVADGRVTVNNATVQAADVSASNGVIHVIDQVILPPNL